jgi:hypothetical protein
LVLYDFFINDASRGRVFDKAVSVDVLAEKSLGDSLVDNDNCDVGLLLSQVVDLCDGLFDL